MGFNCGFDKVKKIDNDPEKCLYMLEYSHFKENTFYTDRFNTFKDYMDSMYKSLYKDFKCKYPDIVYNTDNNDFENIITWNSDGRYIDNLLKPYISEIKPFECYLITNDIIDKLLNLVEKYLSKDKLIPVTVTHSFRYVENGDKLMTLCDGILTQDEDGHEALIDLEFENIWIASRNINLDEYNIFESFKEVLLQIKSIDLDEYYIYYHRSY